MLGIWGESGAIGSGIAVAAMSIGFPRVLGASHWLMLGVHLQEVDCRMQEGRLEVGGSLNLKFFMPHVADVRSAVVLILATNTIIYVSAIK